MITDNDVLYFINRLSMCSADKIRSNCQSSIWLHPESFWRPAVARGWCSWCIQCLTVWRVVACFSSQLLRDNCIQDFWSSNLLISSILCQYWLGTFQNPNTILPEESKKDENQLIHLGIESCFLLFFFCQYFIMMNNSFYCCVPTECMLQHK